MRLRSLLIWPLLRRRIRRSMAWRLSLSHLLTVLLTLLLLFAILGTAGAVITLLQRPAASEPARDAREVTRLFPQGINLTALRSAVYQDAAATVLRALAERTVKLDQDLSLVSITFESPRRLEHVNSISVVDRAGTIVISSAPALTGRHVSVIAPYAEQVAARALAGATGLEGNSIIRRAGDTRAVGAYPLLEQAGEPAAVVVDKAGLTNPSGWDFLGEALGQLVVIAVLNTALIAIPAALAALIVGVPLARAIVRPVRALTSATAAIAAGDLSRRVPERGEDELAALAARFNGMADRLGETLAHEAEQRSRAEDRTRELSALLDISRTVASTLDLQALSGLVLDQLRRVIAYTGASILTMEGEDLVMLETRAQQSAAWTHGQRYALDPANPLWAQVSGRRSVRIADIRQDAPLANAYRAVIGPQRLAAAPYRDIRSWMAVPLTAQDRLVGLLTFSYDEPDRFGEADLRLAQAVADLATLAIENARLYHQAAELAALEERTRIARDLHDSVTQSIFSIGMLARAARAQHRRDASTVGDTLRRIDDVAADALREMRSLLAELRPAELEEGGLCAAVERFVQGFRSRTDATVTCEAEAQTPLPARVETAVFRMVQEALGNAAKHAGATAIAVRIAEQDGYLVASVQDNGAGFDPAAPPAADGLRGGTGLRSMRERAAALGLQLTINSRPGGGATVTVRAATGDGGQRPGVRQPASGG